MAGTSKILQTYLGLTHLLGPAYRYAVSRRRSAGKEHETRYPERFGKAERERPEGRLIWMHAASVGETQSLLGLIPALLEARPDLSILLTSGTVTSAALLERDLPERAVHQFAPVDTPGAIRRFLDHWQPDLAIWVESEIWPRMLVETKRREVPMLLLNARVSSKTLGRWTFARRAAENLFSLFDHILVQDKATFALLGDLGVSEAKRTLTGSLKSELAPPLPDAADAVPMMKKLSSRPVWLAASTHTGEDEILLNAHQKISEEVLLILVPRHPERGAAIADMARKLGLRTAQRLEGQPISDDIQVYVADTMGEMGLWYRVAQIAFVGGSLVPIGGHNPYEPILLGCNVVTGPHTGNFSDVYQALAEVGGYGVVQNADDLAEHIQSALGGGLDDEQLARAKACLTNGHSVTAEIRDAVLTWLDPKA